VFLLWHLLRIGFGYVAATALAAVVFAASAGPWNDVGGHQFVRVTGDAQLWLGETGGRLSVGFVQLLLSGFPTAGFVVVWVVAVAAAETWSLRPLIAWLAIGGLAGAALVVPDGLAVIAGAPPEDAMLAALAAGFAAGFVYWLIAGRQSGSWRRALPPPA
jgi:hypothetical protein